MIRHKDHIDVIVYTMGKVGSSTVSTSLKSIGLKCVDVHFLYWERIVCALSSAFQNPEIKQIPPHFFDSLYAHNAIARQDRVRIISLVRNPILRNISAVFQNTPKQLGDDFEAIMARLQDYPTRTPDYWFETDFIPLTGLDIFQMDLDRTADHFRLCNANLDILILKLESDDDRKAELIGRFLDKTVTLKRTNQSETKWYSDIYARIKDAPGSIRQSFVDECMNLKYLRKFYSDAEIDSFLGRAR